MTSCSFSAIARPYRFTACKAPARVLYFPLFCLEKQGIPVASASGIKGPFLLLLPVDEAIAGAVEGPQFEVVEDVQLVAKAVMLLILSKA